MLPFFKREVEKFNKEGVGEHAAFVKTFHDQILLAERELLDATLDEASCYQLMYRLATDLDKQFKKQYRTVSARLFKLADLELHQQLYSAQLKGVLVRILYLAGQNKMVIAVGGRE